MSRTENGSEARDSRIDAARRPHAGAGMRTRSTAPRPRHRAALAAALAAFAVLAPARFAHAGPLYGSDVLEDGLVTIDTATGDATFVGNYGSGFNAVAGLAWDPVTGTLYGMDSSTDSLITIDPATGVGTAVGSDGGLNRRLYTVDTGTGAATVIAPFTPDLGTANSIGALAFDPGNDILYGVGGTALNDFDYTLYTIDVATAALTSVGPLGLTGGNAGLAFDPGAGVLYFADETNDRLYTLDTGTGSATEVGALGAFGTNPNAFVTGLAFQYSASIPAPGTLALALAGAGFARRRSA